MSDAAHRAQRRKRLAVITGFLVLWATGLALFNASAENYHFILEAWEVHLGNGFHFPSIPSYPYDGFVYLPLSRVNVVLLSGIFSLLGPWQWWYTFKAIPILFGGLGLFSLSALADRLHIESRLALLVVLLVMVDSMYLNGMDSLRYEITAACWAVPPSAAGRSTSSTDRWKGWWWPRRS